MRAIEREASGDTEVRMIERCGHSPRRDQPEVVLDPAAAFVERVLERGVAE